MAVIRRPTSDLSAHRPVVLDLGDLRHQAEELERSAAARARAIIEEAEQERQRLLECDREENRAEGRAEGFREGHDEGAAKGRDEALAEMRERIDEVCARWASALDAFEQGRDDLLAAARADVLNLALAISERVVKRAIEADPRALESQLEAAVAQTIRPTRLVVRISTHEPDEMRQVVPTLVQRLSGCEHVDVVEDESMSRGSVVLRTPAGSVDASIETQLRRMAETIVPEQGHSPFASDDAGSNA